MGQHRLAEQPLEQAGHVRMKLQRMAGLVAIEPAQHGDERRFRIDTGLARIGDRVVYIGPCLEPAGLRRCLEKFFAHPQHVRARQEALDAQIAVLPQPRHERAAVVEQMRRIYKGIQGLCLRLFRRCSGPGLVGPLHAKA